MEEAWLLKCEDEHTFRQDVWCDCLSLVRAQLSKGVGPDNLRHLEACCIQEVSSRLRTAGGDSLVSNVPDLVKKALRVALAEHLLEIVQPLPSSTSFEAVSAPTEMEAFENVKPWLLYAKQHDFFEDPSLSDLLSPVAEFIRKCQERVESMGMTAAVKQLNAFVAEVEVGLSSAEAIEKVFWEQDAALTAKLNSMTKSEMKRLASELGIGSEDADDADAEGATRCTFGRALAKAAAGVVSRLLETVGSSNSNLSDISNRLLPEFLSALQSRLAVAVANVNEHLASDSNNEVPSPDKWLHLLGLTHIGTPSRRLLHKSVHELERWLREWISCGGSDATQIDAAQSALERAREQTVISRWVSLRLTLKPAVDRALDTGGLDRLRPVVRQLSLEVQAGLGIPEAEATTSVETLAALEAGTSTQKILNHATACIESACDNDPFVLPGTRNFSRVPRAVIARLRRSVEFMHEYGRVLPEDAASCARCAQALLGDFARWQPYARWMELLSSLSRWSPTEPVEKLLCEAERVLSSRPNQLSAQTAAEHVGLAVEAAIKNRVDTLLQRTATLPAGSLHGCLDETFKADVEDLRCIAAMLNNGAFGFDTTSEGWSSRMCGIRECLDVALAWMFDTSTSSILAELVRNIHEKGAATVLIKIRHTYPSLVALGLVESEVGHFIASRAEVKQALTDRVTHAMDEVFKWIRPKSGSRTSSLSARGVRSRPVTCVVDSLFSEAMPDHTIIDAFESIVPRQDFAGVPASAIRDVQGWARVAALCGLTCESTLSESPQSDHCHRTCLDALQKCQVLICQCEIWRTQSAVRDTLSMLRRTFLQAALPTCEDLRRKRRDAVREVKAALSELQEVFSQHVPACLHSHSMSAPVPEAHIDFQIMELIFSLTCEEKLAPIVKVVRCSQHELSTLQIWLQFASQQQERLAKISSSGKAAGDFRSAANSLILDAAKEKLQSFDGGQCAVSEQTDLDVTEQSTITLPPEADVVLGGQTKEMMFVRIQDALKVALLDPWLQATRESIVSTVPISDRQASLLTQIESTVSDARMIRDNAMELIRAMISMELNRILNEVILHINVGIDSEMSLWLSEDIAHWRFFFENFRVDVPLLQSLPLSLDTSLAKRCAKTFENVCGALVAKVDQVRQGEHLVEALHAAVDDLVANSNLSAAAARAAIVPFLLEIAATPLLRLVEQLSTDLEGLSRSSLEHLHSWISAFKTCDELCQFEVAHELGNDEIQSRSGRHDQCQSDTSSQDMVRESHGYRQGRDAKSAAEKLISDHAELVRQKAFPLARDKMRAAFLHRPTSSMQLERVVEDVVKEITVHINSQTLVLDGAENNNDTLFTFLMTNLNDDVLAALTVLQHQIRDAQQKQQKNGNGVVPSSTGASTVEWTKLRELVRVLLERCGSLAEGFSAVADAQQMLADYEHVSCRRQCLSDLHQLHDMPACEMEQFIATVLQSWGEATSSLEPQQKSRESAEFDQSIREALNFRVGNQAGRLAENVRKQDVDSVLAKLRETFGLTDELLNQPLFNGTRTMRCIRHVIALAPLDFEAVPLGDSDDLRLALLVTEAECKRVGSSERQNDVSIQSSRDLLSAELIWQRYCLQHEYRKRLAELVLYDNPLPTLQAVRGVIAKLNESMLEMGLHPSAQAQERELFDVTSAAILLKELRERFKVVSTRQDEAGTNVDSVNFSKIADLLEYLTPNGPWPSAGLQGSCRWPDDGDAEKLIKGAEKLVSKIKAQHHEDIYQKAIKILERHSSNNGSRLGNLSLNKTPPRSLSAIFDKGFQDSRLNEEVVWVRIQCDLISGQLFAVICEVETCAMKNGDLTGAPSSLWEQLESSCEDAQKLLRDMHVDDPEHAASVQLRKALQYAFSMQQCRDAWLLRAAWRAAEKYLGEEYTKRGIPELHNIFDEAERVLKVKVRKEHHSACHARFAVLVRRFILQEVDSVLLRILGPGTSSSRQAAVDHIFSPRHADAHLVRELMLLTQAADVWNCQGEVIDTGRNVIQLCKAEYESEQASKWFKEAKTLTVVEHLADLEQRVALLDEGLSSLSVRVGSMTSTQVCGWITQV